MTKIQNNEITHTSNSGGANIVLGSSGEVTPNRLIIGSDAAGDIMYHNGTQYIRLAKGTWGQALAMNRAATAPEWGIGIPTAIVADVKSQNTNGGTFTASAWRTRDLNTVIHETHADIVTLNSNNMVVPTGTYLFHWSTPGALVNSFVSQLYRTDSGAGTPGGGAATVKAGSVEYASASGDTQSRSMGHAIAIVTSDTEILKSKHMVQQLVLTMVLVLE